MDEQKQEMNIDGGWRSRTRFLAPSRMGDAGTDWTRAAGYEPFDGSTSIEIWMMNQRHWQGGNSTVVVFLGSS